MSENIAFKASARTAAGTGNSRALRRDGRVPVAIYGGDKEATTASVDANEMNVEYNKGHIFTSLCDLEIDGEKELTLVRDVQVHPVTDNVLHVDFMRVTPRTRITANVPLHFINHEESPGIKERGVLNAVMHEIEVYCRAMNIPESIEIDLTGLEIGQSIRLGELTMEEGVVPTAKDPNMTVANLVKPRAVKTIEEEEAEAAAAAEGEEGAEGEGAEKAEGDASDSEGKSEE